jgi:hypothetical protein
MFVAVAETFEPFGSFLDIVFGSFLGDGLGNDGPLTVSAVTSLGEGMRLTPFLSRSLIH